VKVSGSVKPLHARIAVTDMEFGEKLSSSGLIIPSTDGKSSGVHPRWGRVHVKGNGNTDDYKVGDWVLIEHGRWTRTINVDQDDGSVLKVWIVDETGIIGWSDETPEEILVGDLSSGVAPPTDFTQGNN
jgi:co-chaperonin GroES (HSP10)